VTRRPSTRAAWFESGIHPRTAQLWRGVEAQHLVATMKLVDAAAEQHLLEELLEANKPALPAQGQGMHYLIATPFRYRPRHESRFRVAGSPGLWYGAETIEVACAEVAYWKWRFLNDSDALRDQSLHTQHTFFEARVSGACIDLTASPWSASSAAWTHPTRYDDCQALANAARDRDVAWSDTARRASRRACAASRSRLRHSQSGPASRNRRGAARRQSPACTCAMSMSLSASRLQSGVESTSATAACRRARMACMLMQEAAP